MNNKGISLRIKYFFPIFCDLIKLPKVKYFLISINIKYPLLFSDNNFKLNMILRLINKLTNRKYLYVNYVLFISRYSAFFLKMNPIKYYKD